jgi:hypothetical protein
VALLEAWKTFESERGTTQVQYVQGLMPQATKRRRAINDAGDLEECASIGCHLTFWKVTCIQYPDWDMVFADDERKSNPTGFAFLQAAHLWKQRKQQAQAQGDGTVANLLAAAPPNAVIEDREYPGSEDDDEDLELKPDRQRRVNVQFDEGSSDG